MCRKWENGIEYVAIIKLVRKQMYAKFPSLAQERILKESTKLQERKQLREKSENPGGP